MRIQESSQDGLTVLTLVGRLHLAAAAQAQRTILKQLGKQPLAIVCDLAGVEGIDPLCAGVFTSMRHPALGWPDSNLVLCGIPPAIARLLTRQGVPGRLPTYDSLEDALTNARTRP